jgi:hypothetical protein
MNKRSIRDYLEISLVVVPCVALIIALVANSTRRKPGVTFYFVSKEAVQLAAAPRKLAGFVSPMALQIEPVNAESTNVVGWMSYTNSLGTIQTQWFRCQIKSARVIRTDFFRQQPTGSNAGRPER